jgi:hypothetical protein
MPDPRQRPIPVTVEERKILNALKDKYEQITGDKGTWSHFLLNIALFSLTAIGANKLSKQVAPGRFQCPECLATITVVSAKPLFVGFVLISCPECNKEIVVGFERK